MGDQHVLVPRGDVIAAVSGVSKTQVMASGLPSVVQEPYAACVVSRARAVNVADAIFESRTHRDYSASGSTFPTEGNVDAQSSKTRLRARRAACERTRIFGAAQDGLLKQSSPQSRPREAHVTL